MWIHPASNLRRANDRDRTALIDELALIRRMDETKERESERRKGSGKKEVLKFVKKENIWWGWISG